LEHGGQQLPNNYGKTPLSVATSRGYSNIVELLKRYK